MLLKVAPENLLTIRQWFALLVIACILPTSIASGALLYYSYKRERADMERAAIEITRALMGNVDRELSSAEAALEALSTSPYLASGELDAFYRQATELLPHRPGQQLLLTDPSGQQLLNTLVPFGTPLPTHGNPAQIRKVAETGKADVSDLYYGRVADRLVISVDVPVMRGGRVRQVLSMQYQPDRLGNILLGQRMPQEWVAAVLDSNGVVVARSRAPEQFVGKHATPGLRQQLARTPEGSVEDWTMEGIPSVAVFSRSTVSDWAVVIGMERSALYRPLRETLVWLAGGTLLLFALGLMLARLIGEHIASPIRSLVKPAMALGYGESIAIPQLELREAHEVGQALMQASALLVQRTAERDAAERAEQALRRMKQDVEQSEAFLRGIFEESPNVVFLVAADGRVARANTEAERLFGYSHDYFRSLNIDRLLLDPHVVGGSSIRDMLFAITARAPVTGERQLRARRSDGSTFPVDVMASPLHPKGASAAGEGSFTIVTVRDVTLRERYEEALRESEKRFRSTVEHAPIGIAIVSLGGRWMQVNNAICELLGYDKEELSGMTFQDVTHPDDLELDLAYSRKLLRGDIRSYQMEKRYIRKDGRIIPVLLTGSLVRDDNGRPLHFIGQVQDISERKRAEEEVSALNKRLALATRAGDIAVWEWNIATGELVWDERMYALYKVRREDAGRNYEMWRRRLHPDDLERTQREQEEAVAGEREYATEFRIVWPDDQVRWIRANAVVSRDAQGKAVRMTGVNFDITESRQKEQAISNALREKETLLKELYHRVKNNLQVVMSMFNLQERTLPEGPARTALAEGAGRVRAMALVHEKLYQSGNLSSISLDAYIGDLCTQLGSAAGVDRRGIALAVEAEPMEIGLETAVPLGLALNELVCNSLQHAFPEGQGGRVTVQAQREPGGMVRVSVSDDGIGFPQGMTPTRSPSLGLRLVDALSRQLGGKFSVESRGGTRATIVFPLNDAAAGSRLQGMEDKE